MAKASKTTKAKTAKSIEPATVKAPRQLKKPVRKYQSFRLQKRIKHDKKLPSAFKLAAQSGKILAKHWKLFVGLSLIYGLLNAILIGGFKVSSELNDLKSAFDQLLHGGVAHVVSGISLFFYLVSSSGSSLSPTAGAYQFILSIVISLALIWTLRQVYAGHKVRLRDGFYKGLTPLVTFLLVLVVMALQLIPLAVGAFLYSTIIANGIAVLPLEYVLWGLLCFLMGLLSVYMICSSVFALYIVTLPDMTPLAALRSARQLVRYRRWSVMRKILFLPLALTVIGAVLVIPVIMFFTPAAPWLFLVLSTFLLASVNAYMYTLYRELL